jgi:hypothetical protein
MRRQSTPAPIPVIELIQNGKHWEVHWDYREGRATRILFRRRHYLRGYIDGAMAMIGINPDQVLCASGLTGTVKRLEQSKAEQLEAVLQRLLVPLVQAEHQHQEDLDNLPHIRFAAETNE